MIRAAVYGSSAALVLYVLAAATGISYGAALIGAGFGVAAIRTAQGRC